MDLYVAYANVMNPIQLDNPLLQDRCLLRTVWIAPIVLPRLPIGYNDVIIPEEYRRAENGHQFLLFQDSFPNIPGGPLENHILCFGTRKFFKKMCNATVVHMDRTFKVCPAPYQQLFTICSFHHDDNVGYEDSLDNRLLPRMYCLLSGKSHIVYERFFQLVIEKAAHWNYDINWQKSMSDFEQSIFAALTVKFPDVDKKGCHFYFCQALFRRIQHNMKVSFKFIVFLPLPEI